LKRAVIDASALMAALLPNEPLKERARAILRSYVKEELELLAPSLLSYEVANSLLKAERREGSEVSSEVIDAILAEIQELEIPVVDVPPAQVVRVAREYGIWGYDASYLALAGKEDIPLITADKRFYNSVRRRFRRVEYLGGKS